MQFTAVAVVAFVLMEPVTYLSHRFVMHGLAERIHRSHHVPGPGRWEANDAFPVMFAAVVCAGLWLGFHDPSWAALVPVGVGITAYGVAYAAVHDVYIHHRLGGRRVTRLRLLDRLAAAHALHHRHGGAPYGMLVPIVPARLRGQASGSRPSHVPELA